MTDAGGTRPRVLVVDDEPYLAELVATALSYEGFESSIASTVDEALTALNDFAPELIVLDIMLADGDGLRFGERMRRNGDETPIVFLTAKDATEDKLEGLELGDDYVTKPFELAELIARVRAVLRRAAQRSGPGATVRFADLEIDEERYEVRRGGRPIELSPTEYRLLRYLAINAGRVLTKEQLLDHVWNYDFGGSHGVVQTYISYLRRKLDAHGPPLIHTLPRIGYTMRLPRNE